MTSSRVVGVASQLCGSKLLPLLRQLIPNTNIVELSVNKSNRITSDIPNDLNVLLADPGIVANHMYDLPKTLKFVQCTFAGVDLVFQALQPKKVPEFQMTRFGGVFGQHMAEYVIGQIISWERQWPLQRDRQKSSSWCLDEVIDYRILPQLSVAIIGFGDIGMEVAKVCKTFGMTVWGVATTHRSTNPPNVDHYRTVDKISEALAECDVVCSILPSTQNTIGFLDERLKLCKKKPLFMNLGRGDVIADKSIISLLDNGFISGAILDVFPVEPLPEESPLWSHPKIIITPHVSAISFEWQIAELFAKNYQHFTSHESLEYLVDWTKGY